MMYYRQKILLGLIEACGGNLTNTDLEKLLFLYCQATNQNHYDFFPYKFGAFSFMSYFDKTKLIEKGALQDTKRFALTGAPGYLSQLHPLDQASLLSFVQKTTDLRGRRLVRQTYLDFPEYASRSEIAYDVLTVEEYKQVKEQWKTSSESALFTIGYEGRTIDSYLNLLLNNNVCALVDVRQNPISRKHGFSQKNLRTYVKKAGMQYYHLPELGIPSSLRKELDHEEAYNRLFKQYETEILPDQVESLEKIRHLLEKHHRIALTCFEANPCHCHRHKITEVFASDKGFNEPIIHI